MGKSGILGGINDLAFGKPPKIGAPEKRDYLSEMQSALNAQGGIQEQLLGLENKYTPEYLKLQQAGISGGIKSMASLYGEAGGISQGLQNDFLKMQSPIYNQVGQSARNAYQQTLDPTTAGLYNTMATQAAEGLSNGRNLSDQEMRMAQGAARAAMAARGMQMGNQAVAAEVLNSYNLGQAREDRARQFAGQVYGVGQSNAQQAMTMYGVPLMTQLSSYSPTSLVGAGGQLYGGIGAKLFTPESQYNASLISSNISNDMQTNMANAQIQAARQAANMQFWGDIAGSYKKAGWGT